MAFKAVTPMRNTNVPLVRTRASKSMSRGWSFFLWAVMICTEEAQSLWVTGIPL